MKKTVLTLSVFAATAALAAPSFHVVFNSNMVLPRGVPVPVWGAGGTAGETLTVTFGEQTQTCTVGEDGSWSVEFDAMAANSTGQSLRAVGAKSGASATLANILVGDLWLVAGQSNAEYGFDSPVIGRTEMIAAADNYPCIRYLKITSGGNSLPQGSFTPQRNWTVMSSATIVQSKSPTCIGYLMAREINARKGVPVGVIDAACSGSVIQPYISYDGCRAVPGCADEQKEVESCRKVFYDWAKLIVESDAAKDYGRVGEPRSGSCFSTSYDNAMLYPLRKVPLTGVVWYQGESDANKAGRYTDRLTAFVRGLRLRWGANLPVCLVQLSSYEDVDYAPIREIQRRVAATERTGLVVTIDVGSPHDIHPSNKADVAHRAALWAMREVYGDTVHEYTGPECVSATVSGSAVRLKFDHVGDGLFAGSRASDVNFDVPVEQASLSGFQLAGADGKFVWATSTRVDGTDAVVVAASGVTSPKTVRYAYAKNFCGASLLFSRFTNYAGETDYLPASPFEIAVGE